MIKDSFLPLKPNSQLISPPLSFVVSSFVVKPLLAPLTTTTPTTSTMLTSVLFCLLTTYTGGYMANSLAIMTDASHLLTDVSSFLISIIALKMASRPISTKMTFGWHRAGPFLFLHAHVWTQMCKFNRRTRGKMLTFTVELKPLEFNSFS